MAADRRVGAAGDLARIFGELRVALVKESGSAMPYVLNRFFNSGRAAIAPTRSACEETIAFRSAQTLALS